MPANSVDYAADETKAAVNSATDAATKVSAEAQRSFADAAKRIERAVTEGIEQLRAQTRAYTDTAGQQIDQASAICDRAGQGTAAGRHRRRAGRRRADRPAALRRLVAPLIAAPARSGA